MVHPVKTPLGVARGATRISFNVLRHPLRSAGDAVSIGRGVVGAVVTGYRQSPSTPFLHPDRAEAEPAPEAGTAKKHGDALTMPTAQDGPPAPKPVDVTEQAAGEQTAGGEDAAEPVATEPSAVTGPGDEEEIPSSAVPFEEDVEVTTPVGTTGAGHAVNPDTTESDLQQPGTEPLMDPSTTKRIKREAETLRKASDPKKG